MAPCFRCSRWLLGIFPLALCLAAPASSALESASLTVPIVISSSGLAGSFYTSELSLTNRGTTTATIRYTYTAAFGGGGGSATDTLAAGRQITFTDAIAYLISIGLPIPASGNRGGVLRADFTGLSSPDAAAITVRTTTAVSGGRAGLSYSGDLPGPGRRRLPLRPPSERVRPLERGASQRGSRRGPVTSSCGSRCFPATPPRRSRASFRT